MRKIASFTFRPDFVRKGWDVALLLTLLDGIKAHVPIYGENSSAGYRFLICGTIHASIIIK